MYVFNPFTNNFDKIVASLATLDSRYVNTIGDTMTGQLTVDVDGSSAGILTGISVDVDNGLLSAIGIDIGVVSSAAGSAYGIRIAGPSTFSAGYALLLSDTTGAVSGGISWGSDTNLYRSAANILTTDDDFKLTGGTLFTSTVSGHLDGGLLSTVATDATTVDGDGGSMEWTLGLKNGSGSDGTLTIYPKGGTTGGALLDFDALTTVKTFTFPNTQGTLLVHNYTSDVTFGGYLRVGSNVAPTNTTAGDITGVRLMLGTQQTLASALQLGGTGGTTADGITFGTDSNFYRIAAGVLANSGSERIATYLRVGSVSAPNNTTAGDITGTRLSIGNAAFGTNQIVAVTGTNTATASGAQTFANFLNTITPASNSSTEHRALQFQNLINPATGINVNTIRAGYFENRLRHDGTTTESYGVVGAPLIIDSGSAATVGTVGTATAFTARLYQRPSGTSVVIATDLVGFNVESINNAGLTATTFYGLNVNAPSAGTYTTQYGARILSLSFGSTNNVGIQVSHPALTGGIGASTENTALLIPAASVTIGNQTAILTNKHGVSIGIVTMISSTLVRTITNSASLYIAGAPVASTNVTITNGPYSIWVDGGTTRLDGAVIINEDGADIDTRIEGDTATDLFFVDASTDRVGINSSSPQSTFDVNGRMQSRQGATFNSDALDSDTSIKGDADDNLFYADASVDRIGIGTNSPTQKFDINSDSFRLRTAKTPSSATDTGTQGQIAWDATHFYICVATNTWQRVAHATW